MMKCFWGFIKAFARVQWARFRGYEMLADPGVSGVRWLHCSHCSYFDGVQCQACCCMVEAKTLIAVESCPKGFWRAVWIKKVDREANSSDS